MMGSLPPSYLALLLLAVYAEGVLAVDDVDEMIAVIIFAVLIVIFALIALFFLIMIIRLKREQREVSDSRKRRQRDIVRINTERGLKTYTEKHDPSRLRTLSEGSTNTNPSTLLPISEKGEEDVDIVPSYDKVSDRSSFYEKVNGPNPAYQQYKRKGVDGIPINLMKPKQHHTETIENTLFDAEGVTDLEEEPVTVPMTKPPTDGMTDDVASVYAVPNKRANTSTSITSGFLHTCEDADVVPVSSYLEIEDVEHKAAAGHDMSIFVSTSHSKLDNIADPGTEGDISASMDNDSDDVFTAAAANMAAHQRVSRADSILSTTSEDCDLLNTGKKLKGRPKISHPKSKHFGNVNVAAKNTPSPKPKRANPGKFQAPIPDSRDTSMAATQQKIEVARSESISSTTSDNRNLVDTDVKVKDHPKISHSVPKFLSNIGAAIKSTPSPKSKRANLRFKPPTADGKATQLVAKYTTTDSTAAQLVTKTAKDTVANSKTARDIVAGSKAGSKMTQSVAKEHFDKHDYKQVTQTKPQQNFKPTVPHKSPIDFPHKASPKLNTRHGSQPTAPSPKLSKSKVLPTTGAYLNTSHPTQVNPLAQLRAKSSPRVKPRSAVLQPQEFDTKPADSAMATHEITKQQLPVPQPTKEMKRSSIATDKPVTDDVTDKAAVDEKRRHTVCDLSYKERRDKEMDELDQTLKDLDDFITTI